MSSVNHTDKIIYEDANAQDLTRSAYFFIDVSSLMRTVFLYFFLAVVCFSFLSFRLLSFLSVDRLLSKAGTRVGHLIDERMSTFDDLPFSPPSASI